MPRNTQLQLLSELLSQLLQKLPSSTQTPEVERALLYADGLLRRQLLYAQGERLPPQFVVIGPTQSGKSSLVNLLLGSDAAEASPLAGHTRTLQGFSAEQVSPAQRRILQQLLGDLAGEISLQQIATATDDLPAMVLWDTPDFDSVHSRGYRQSVPLICAAADYILLVVSREKYADQSVWSLLRLLAPVATPLVICINKCDADAEPLLRESLQQRLQQESITAVDIVTLPYLNQAGEQIHRHPAAQTLRLELLERVPADGTDYPAATLQRLLREHWADWLGPVYAEHAAIAKWSTMVAQSLDEALQIYRQEYLSDPRFADAMQRAMVRLLELLEVPGIAAGLQRIRLTVTWPVRQLQRLWKSREDESQPDGATREREAILRVLAHLQLQLRQQLSSELQAETGDIRSWWSRLEQRLGAQLEGIDDAMRQAITPYQQRFDAQIDATAETLYQHLQQHPLTLNGLRAARVTTDAAAVTLAVKSAGIGLGDLLLTPAMIAFTSLLTEGALGKFMQQTEKELSEQQFEQVREQLFDAIAGERLLALALHDEQGCGIDGERLQRAEQALQELAG